MEGGVDVQEAVGPDDGGGMEVTKGPEPSPGFLDPLSPESDTASMRTCASTFESSSASKARTSGSSTEMHTAESRTITGGSSDTIETGSEHGSENDHLADSSGPSEFRPEQMEFFDSPRMLKLAAEQGRVPFGVRSSSSGSSLQSDVEDGDEVGSENRQRLRPPEGSNCLLNGADDVGSDEDDTYTCKPDAQVTKVASERPTTLSVPNGTAGVPGRSGRGGAKSKRKKISVAEDILNTADDVSSIRDLSEEMFTAPLGDDPDATENIVTPDDLETPDEIDDSIMEKLSELEFDDDRTPTPEELRLELGLDDVDDEVTLNDGRESGHVAEAESSRSLPERIPTLSFAEEQEEARSWRNVVISGIERRIDMKAIEPYKKVLSHGGYMEDSNQAIIVFTACYLPDHARVDYEWVMDNLFLYCLTTLDALIADDYVLVYLHGATHRSRVPSFKWIRRCYQMIDRRLRKNLKGLYVVHPTFLVKTLVTLTRPFISSKFSRKLRFVGSLDELSRLVPMGQVVIPEKVRTYDEKYYAPDRSSKKSVVKEDHQLKPGIRLNSDSDDGDGRGASDC